MKKIKYIIGLFCILATFSFTACEPDTENDNDNLPTIDEREKFHGSWSCEETANMTYTVNIVADTTSTTQMKLYNFHNLGFEEKVLGIVSGKTLSIPSQSICQNTINITGTSTMRNDETHIDFYYIYDDGVNRDTIQAVYTKQN